MHEMPRIGLLFDANQGLGRALLAGIVKYARLHGPWQFAPLAGDVKDFLKRLEKHDRAGVIAHVDCAAVEEALASSRLPAVLHCVLPGTWRPRTARAQHVEVGVDWRAAATLAAEHLLERGLRSFAFVGGQSPVLLQTSELECGFRERLSRADCHAASCDVPALGKRRPSERLRGQLAKWVKRLPRPVGILACDDLLGREALEACHMAGLATPRDVAVVAIETDDLLCELADPPLTSVALNGEAGGYRAASALDAMLRGSVRRPARVVILPAGVVPRTSTHTLAAGDPQVAAALDLMHGHAMRSLGVGDIVKRLPISRRALELRFRKAMGRGPHDELQRVRLDRAQKLLMETDLSMPEIAAAAGYSSASYLAQVFQRRIGWSPAQYRRAHRTPRMADAANREISWAGHGNPGDFGRRGMT